MAPNLKPWALATLAIALLAIGAISLLSPAPAIAQTPYMNYQGRVNNPDGSALTSSTYTMEFSVWTDPFDQDASKRAWGPFILDGGSGDGHGPQATVTDGGRFNVILGPLDTAGVPIAQAFGSPAGDRFVEVKVGANAAILPRTIFTCTPLAFRTFSVFTDGDKGLHVLGSPVGADTRITIQSTYMNINGDINVDGSTNLLNPLLAVNIPKVKSTGANPDSATTVALTLGGNPVLATNGQICMLSGINHGFTERVCTDGSWSNIFYNRSCKVQVNPTTNAWELIIAGNFVDSGGSARPVPSPGDSCTVTCLQVR